MNINLMVAAICLASIVVTSRAGMAQPETTLADEKPVSDLSGDRWTSFCNPETR